jgi:hypothetical protein
MLFPRLLGSTLVILLAASCTDSTAPSRRVTAVYVLETIDGQSLPATVSTNAGPTTTVFWGTLSLDAAGKATIVEHRSNQSGGNQQGQTSAGRTDYKLTGTSIYVGPPCLDDTPDCMPGRVGEMAETTLTLSGPISEPHSRVYAYRLALED